jgi:biotin operon repressor
VNTGWISLHRKITKWEWYDDANTFRVFIHCLLLANHEKKKWRGIDVERGQFITSQANLGLSLGLSVQSIRTCLDKLKSTDELTVNITNKYSIISITNYDEMQGDNRQANSESTVNQQSTNIESTVNQQQTITITTKELNNDNKKEVKKRFAIPSLNEINELIKEKQYHINGEVFFNHYESNGWKVGKNQMKSWRAALSNWNSRENKNGLGVLSEKDKFYADMQSDTNKAIEGECHVVK